MVVCPFIDEETNGSYLLANGLNYFTTYVDPMIFLELGVEKTGKRKLEEVLTRFVLSRDSR
jgi:hypothetical protein